jgi:hypothetical protein
MVADMDRLVDSPDRRGYPALSMHSLILPDEFHVTVAPLILSRGLRYPYDEPRQEVPMGRHRPPPERR